MGWQTDNQTTDLLGNFSWSIVSIATAVLILTASMGAALPGLKVAGYHLFWFRLYLPIYAAFFVWYLWQTNNTLLRPRTIQLFAAFSAFAMLSVVWAEDLRAALRGGFFLLSSIFVGGAVYSTSKTDKVLSRYLAVVFALTGLAIFMSFWEIFTGQHLASSRLNTVELNRLRFGVDMATAWFYNRNNLAFYLATTAPLLAAYSLDSRQVLRRWGSALAVVLSVVVIWAVGSTASVLMSIVTLPAVLGLYLVRPRLRNWTLPEYSRLLTVVGVLTIAGVSLTALIVFQNPFNRVHNYSIWARWQIAVVGIQIMVESAGVGVGIGNFVPAASTFEMPTNGVLASHNWLIYLVGEFGIIGTTLFLAGYSKLLFDVFARYLEDGHWYLLGFCAALLGVPLGALSPATALHTPTFWLCVGLSAGAVYQVNNNRGS